MARLTGPTMAPLMARPARPLMAPVMLRLPALTARLVAPR
jgi:hypothetical protein